MGTINDFVKRSTPTTDDKLVRSTTKSKSSGSRRRKASKGAKKKPGVKSPAPKAPKADKP